MWEAGEDELPLFETNIHLRSSTVYTDEDIVGMKDMHTPNNNKYIILNFVCHFLEKKAQNIK